MKDNVEGEQIDVVLVGQAPGQAEHDPAWRRNLSCSGNGIRESRRFRGGTGFPR